MLLNEGFDHTIRQATMHAELIVKVKGSLEGRVEKEGMETSSMITGSKDSVVQTNFSLLSGPSARKGHGDHGGGIS